MCLKISVIWMVLLIYFQASDFQTSEYTQSTHQTPYLHTCKFASLDCIPTLDKKLNLIILNKMVLLSGYWPTPLSSLQFNCIFTFFSWSDKLTFFSWSSRSGDQIKSADHVKSARKKYNDNDNCSYVRVIVLNYFPTYE